jgi:hypothetical protein
MRGPTGLEGLLSAFENTISNPPMGLLVAKANIGAM